MFDETTPYMSEEEYQAFKLGREYIYQINAIRMRRAQESITSDFHIKVLEELAEIKDSICNSTFFNDK